MWTKASEVRVHLRNHKPYAIVNSLDDLAGPAAGVIDLPHSVLWAPGGSSVNLDDSGGTALAYQAVLAEGTVEDLQSVLNLERLLAVWPTLMMPSRVRRMWEERFPELTH